MDAFEWNKFLHSWQSALLKQYSVSSEIWHEYGFGNPEKFSCFRSVDSERVLRQEWSSRINAKEIANFYSVSNGWPLFVGPDKIEISPAEDINFFRDVDGPWFDLAVGADADYEPPLEGDDYDLSMSEFQTSIVISRPVGAREVVLWLESGQICLFTYDGVMRHESLASFLSSVLSRLINRFE